MKTSENRKTKKIVPTTVVRNGISSNVKVMQSLGTCGQTLIKWRRLKYLCSKIWVHKINVKMYFDWTTKIQYEVFFKCAENTTSWRHRAFPFLYNITARVLVFTSCPTSQLFLAFLKLPSTISRQPVWLTACQSVWQNQDVQLLVILPLRWPWSTWTSNWPLRKQMCTGLCNTVCTDLTSVRKSAHRV